MYISIYVRKFNYFPVKYCDILYLCIICNMLRYFSIMSTIHLLKLCHIYIYLNNYLLPLSLPANSTHSQQLPIPPPKILTTTYSHLLHPPDYL